MCALCKVLSYCCARWSSKVQWSVICCQTTHVPRDGCAHVFVPASGWDKVKTQNQLWFWVSHVSALSLLLRWEEPLEEYPYLPCLCMKACVYARWSRSELSFSASIVFSLRVRWERREAGRKRIKRLAPCSCDLLASAVVCLWRLIYVTRQCSSSMYETPAERNRTWDAAGEGSQSSPAVAMGDKRRRRFPVFGWTSGLPVALKKKQPYTSSRAPFGGHY